MSNNALDEEYARETNLRHLISRVGTASSRSFENKPRIIRKKAPKLTRPIDATLNIDHDEDFGAHKLLSTYDREVHSRADTHSALSKKNKEELLAKVKCDDEEFQEIFKNSSTNLRPLIHFFKFLVPKPPSISDQPNQITKSKLVLAIPHTVIYGIEENPIMYYTSDEGFIVRVDNPSTKTIKKKLTSNTRSENEMVVLAKRPLIGDTVTNHVTLMNVKQVNELLENQSQGTTVLQRYIKCRGSKACFTRVVWSMSMPCSGYMLGNKKTMNDLTEKELSKKLLISTDSVNSLHVYQMQGTAIRPLDVITERIVKHIQNIIRPRVQISDMAVDFIRDEAGLYWFLQVKGIKLTSIPKIIPRSSEHDDEEMSQTSKRRYDYIRLKECKMCLNQYPPSELEYSMTLKMIFATEKHLKRRSVRLAWFDRPEFRYVKDTSTWYQTHTVCKNCFDMYLQEQKLAKVEVKFAKAIGIPVNEKANDNASILNTMKSGVRVKNKFKSMTDEHESEGPDSLIMYRFIIYLNELRNIPENLPNKFSLQFSIFGCETVVPVKRSPQSTILNIGKLRVFYFFVRNRDVFRQWIQNEKVRSMLITSVLHMKNPTLTLAQRVTINLCMHDEVVGYATLLLNQFASNLIEKLDYMVLFSSSKLKLCSLRATMGFTQMRATDVSNIKLTEHRPGIYVPPPDFFTADPLPDEWIETIPRLTGTSPRHMSNTVRTTPVPARKAPTSLRQRPSSASVIRKTKSLLSGRTSADEYVQSQIKQDRDTTKRPVSASVALNRRATSAARLSNLDSYQFNLSYTKRDQGGPSGTIKVRPHSAGVIRSKHSQFSPGRPASSIHAWRSENESFKETRTPKLNLESHRELVDNIVNDINSPCMSSASEELKYLPRYGPKDDVWVITLKIPSLCEIDSNVDDSWIVSYNMFNVIRKQHESFHMFSDGPLVFNVEEEFFIVCTEESLNSFFGKERLFKIIFSPKYSYDDEHVAAIDLRQLQKSLVIEQEVSVERVRSDEVDHTKFLDGEEDEDDDQFVDDEPDVPDTTHRAETNTKVNIYLGVRRLGRMLDLERTASEEIGHEAVVEEFNITVLRGKPFSLLPMRKTSFKISS